jgi:hypothetical protein
MMKVSAVLAPARPICQAGRPNSGGMEIGRVTRNGSSDRRPRRRDGGLLAAVAVAGLVVAAVGVRAAAGAALRDGGLAAAAAVGLALLFAIGALTAAAKYRAHVHSTDVATPALDRLRQATVAVLFAGAVLVPLAMILLRRPAAAGRAAPGQSPAGLPFQSARAQPTRLDPTPRTGRSFSFDLTAFLWAFGIAIGVAVLVLLVFTAVRLLARAPRVEPVRPAAPVAGTGSEDEALADALAAGRGALDGNDARAAIIACYAAMEDSLAQAGVARERADSPSDLLRRATARQLPGGGAAGAMALTELFREARFSSHPMTARDLDAARRALDAVTDALAERVAARGDVTGSAPAEAGAARR